MANQTTVTLVNGVPTAPSGTVSTIDALMADGGQATIGAKADAAAATTDVTPISAMSVFKQISKSIQAAAASLAAATPAGANVIGHVIVDTAPTTAVTIATAPVLVAGSAIVGKVGIDQTTPGTTNKVSIGTDGTVAIAASTTDVAVTPTVTASAYTAGNVIGGIMTFANILAATSFNGVLQSITAKFKASAVVGNLEVAIFKGSPSNGTYTDKTAPTWNASDMANLVGIYVLSSPNSKLGTMTIYNLDGVGKSLVGGSTSLFAVVIVDGTPTPASTSDFTLQLSVLPG